MFNAFVGLAAGKNCETLDGKWYNQLGSEVFLKHEKDGTLYGEYRTAVERHNGSSGIGHSIVLGSAPYDYPGAAFAFSVVWRNGSSTTVWTGQCLVCENGDETLLTSWLLRAKVNTCIDKWKSTMIGRDTFTRYEQRDGPRKPTGTTEAPPNIVTVIKNWDPDGKNKPCNLNGNWYNTLGSEMIINQGEDSTIKGEYRTAVERETGAAGTSHSKVLGIGQLGGPNSTFAFFVVWRNGASVTGWVGQCHICGENKTEILESTWLLRSKIEKCSDNWKSTLYNEDTFTHTETTPGPRKKDDTHTPDRDDKNPRACKGYQLLFSFTLLSLSMLSSLVQWY
ncbi:hypothetical protein OS493_007978 [Desmophyllum pertusum]|uniref:Uncharacterized protein n=1 Tax=Desmophyllum pertusum TaxID=174260 RepID=A0A9X0CG99_9CNID|nr:hypothetical protein OS493_007978 [Desmophyllum pertusum]